MMAAALSAGTLKPTDAIDCEHGTYQLAGVTIHDTHLNDMLTPTQILAKSSNIGALKIGLELGEPALYAAYRRFGFGEPTGVPLPGEAAGVLRPKGRPWYEVETANASFGQGISVTTLQLAMAMGAIANGGKLLEPILVKRVSDGRGEVVRESPTRVRREAVSPWVAKTLSEMLTAVTEDGGTAVEAAVPGFRVAGKTSTAQKVDPATGKYSAEKYTAVFVGFVPADKPRLVIAVVLDEPMIGRYGGDLAGPVFRRVAEASLRYLGVTPSANDAALAGRGRSQAAWLGAAKRDGDPADLTLSMLKAPAAPSSERSVPTSPAMGPPPPDAVRVPDATGMPAHEAVLAITKAGLVPVMEGSGRAVRQYPAPGAPASKGSTVRLVFEPAS
jgi:cell division protein FtsI (penicillin-binding protein 3)